VAGILPSAERGSRDARPGSSGKDWASTRGGRRGTGPSTHARVAEIMSGRAWSQQGLATTCKDSGLTGELEGPERDKVWRVSLYERRRRGNALRGDLRGRPDGSVIGQRGSGHSAAVGVLTQPDTVLDICGRCGTAKGWSKLLRGLGCERAGVSPKWLRGKARPDKCPAEPRPEPDSRNATVRDHRGASGDVAHGGTRTPPRNRKGEAGNAPPTGARAWDLSRREQESPVLETSTPGLMRRGLETGPGRPTCVFRGILNADSDRS